MLEYRCSKCRNRDIKCYISIRYEVICINDTQYIGKEEDREISSCLCKKCGHSWIPRKS